MKKPKIIIIGAGFAGLSCLLQLIKKKVDAEITIIDKDDHFEYTPSLHLAFNNLDYLKKITFSLKKYYKEYFRQETVIKVEKHKVYCKSKKKYDFDYCVIATGSKANFFNNKSFEKYGHPLRRVSDAKNINKLLKKSKKVTIIGGGYTGMEIATVLATETNKDISIVHSPKRLMNTMSPKVSKICENYINKLNIPVFYDYGVKFGKDFVQISSGKKIKTDLIIFSAGVLSNDSIYSKKVEINDQFCIKNDPHVFFCGDAVRTSLPPTAHNAMIEGRKVGLNLYKIINEIPLSKPSDVPRKNELLAVALGDKDGILALGHSGIYIPLLIGLLKKFVEIRILFELKKKIMLPL